MFSRTLDEEHWKNAIKVKTELEENDHLTDLQLMINTKDLIEQGFQFPKVATYDNVVSQLTEVQNAEDNLNQN